MARVLLVEDDEVFGRTARRVLAHDGHRVDHATTIARARGLVASCAFERAILDVNLPDGDGLELLGWMRQAGQDTEVLVLTGRDDRSLTARAFLLGAALVYKPTPIDVLRAFASTPRRASVPNLLHTTRIFASEHHLSPRQTELLVNIAAGIQRRALSVALGVEENTVKTMVRQVLEKTNTATIDELRCTLLERGAPSPQHID